jgi:hypothetical protein
VLDAELAVSSLAAAGIEAELADDGVVGVVWTYSVHGVAADSPLNARPLCVGSEHDQTVG